MPRIFGTVDLLEFDSAGYSKAVRQQLQLSFRFAARAFLRAAIPKIPVETGMARGSYLFIGRALNVAVPINPTLFGQKYRLPSGNKIPKTPESGAALTTAPENIIREVDGRLIFEIDSSVLHYTLADLLGVKPGPWGSIGAGRAAFTSELEKQLAKRLPDIGEYILKTTVSFGRNGGVKSAPIRLRQQKTVN